MTISESRSFRSLSASCAAGVMTMTLLLAGCAATSPDRTEEITLESGATCTYEWRLESQSDDAGEAVEVAEDALSEAAITEADIAKWREVLRAEYVDEFGEPDAEKAAEFERLAPIEVVREYVRDALAAAGFPDSPKRLVEVRGSNHCTDG